MFIYRNLIVWQKAHGLTCRVYKFFKKFPHQEIFELTSQLRRFVLSISTNMVEGYANRSNKEFMSFIDIALSSLVKAEYPIKFAKDLK